MITLIGYPPCSTCKAVAKQLKQMDIDYVYRDITEDVPSKDELLEIFQKSGHTSVKKLLNTSGVLYREGNYKDKLANLSIEEIFEEVSKDGMLIKRPILVTESKAYIGKDIQTFMDLYA